MYAQRKESNLCSACLDNAYEFDSRGRDRCMQGLGKKYHAAEGGPYCAVVFEFPLTRTSLLEQSMYMEVYIGITFMG